MNSVLQSKPAKSLALPNPLQNYRAAGLGSDLFGGASENARGKWNAIAGGLAQLCDGDLARLHEQIREEIEDLGLTFRLSGDKEERHWPLSPMPLVIDSNEWAEIEQGLIQRAEILEAVIADIYKDQKLLTQGDLPAPVIAGSRHFTRKMLGCSPPGEHYLHHLSVDLARGPSGQWRVLTDRLRIPSGMGYALENRMAIARISGPLLAQSNTRRLAEFFGQMRQGMANDCKREDPRIALLSAGQFNQSYAEQAHLARYLGLPLVEGRDLVVEDQKLFIRTIAGPIRIDGLWRWMDTHQLDPMAFDASSLIGVPNLFEAWRDGGLMMSNWPGAGVLEARAFSAFLPRLARKLTGEGLNIPNVATWWCGQENEAEVVKKKLGEMVISSAFGEPVSCLPDGRTRQGCDMSSQERAELIAAIERRPMDYCGQEIVHLSTTPTLIEGTFEPRPFTLRAFLARNAQGNWQVMPGGFARIPFSGDLRTSLMGRNDLSADVCIVDETALPEQGNIAPRNTPTIHRASGILSSQAADNLYWFCRYFERAEASVRLLRSLLGSSIDVDGSSGHETGAAQRLIASLVQSGAISAKHKDLPIVQLSRIALEDENQVGSLAQLLHQSRRIGSALRDRITTDFWRILRYGLPQNQAVNHEALLDDIAMLIERFAIVSGMINENMVRSHAWRFLEIGRRVERATNICRIARKFGSSECQQDDLNVLLDLCDSQITYRARYLAPPMHDLVLDLILCDPNNPRSLLFQIHALEEHLEQLPQLVDNGVSEASLQKIRKIRLELNAVEVGRFSLDLLKDIELRLFDFSDALSRRYFLQTEKVEQPEHASLLA